MVSAEAGCAGWYTVVWTGGDEAQPERKLAPAKRTKNAQARLLENLLADI